MFERDAAMDIFMRFLDRKVKEAEEEIARKGILSDDKAIPLMLKTQFNHIAHLETDIGGLRETMDRRFGEMKGEMKEDMDCRFREFRSEMDRRFTGVERHLRLGFAALGLLIAAFRFIH